MNQIENIEYFLGKDSFKNEYFKFTRLEHGYKINDTGMPYHALTSSQHTFTRNFGMENQSADVTFHFNNLGFRDFIDYSIESLSKYNGLTLVLGCSDVCGPNLNYEDLAVTHMMAQFPADHRVLNLGILGAAPDTVVRIAMNFCTLLNNVKHVCVIWPNPRRREIVSVNGEFIIGAAGTMAGECGDITETLANFIDWKSNSYNFHKNKIMLEQFCELKHISLSQLLINRNDSKVPFDYASAYNAFGPLTNRAIANYFLKQIRCQPTLYESLNVKT